MILEGSANDSEKEIKKALRLPDNKDLIRKQFRELLENFEVNILIQTNEIILCRSMRSLITVNFMLRVYKIPRLILISLNKLNNIKLANFSYRYLKTAQNSKISLNIICYL